MSDSSRLARLNAIKLATLVREHLGDEAESGPALEPGEFPGGAAARRAGKAWVLLHERPERGLGGALAWALRQGCDEVHVVAEQHTGLLARRAEGFSLPVQVWHAEGRSLLPAVAEPLPVPPDVPAHHLEFVEVIAASGAAPHVEFGVLSGEVDGLEVCRVVDDPYLDVTRLEVGVGAHDREAFLALHGDRPTAPALADVVASVAEHRRAGDGHPLSRLAGERRLRAQLVAEPGLIGADRVEAAPPPVPRPNLKDPVPCCAVATIRGQEVGVVCSTGVDLDAVPFAVDARHSLGMARVLLVLPARDAIAVQRLLAEAASPPVTVVPVG